VAVPKLWTETIEAHRREVRDAIMDAVETLIAENGLLSVTMSQIAERTGIGRATLYKYFPDVKAVLFAWHERQIAEHLRRLVETRERIRDPGTRLEAVLAAYALIHQQRVKRHGHQPQEFLAILHQGEAVDRAHREVQDMIRDLLREAVAAGHVRADVAAEELAAYCLHALTAAGTLPSEAAVHRLVGVVLAGIRPGAERP
jgi:AcrR family transcriptional regulator